MALHDRIKQRREEKGISAADLARRANLSKSYISELESGRAPRPSGDVLFRLAAELGTTVADLLERQIEPASRPTSPSLRQFAEQAGLLPEDVEMLSQISFRGEQPRTLEDWRFLYESIKRSIRRE